MWGNQDNTRVVRCHLHDVCEVCGKTRRDRPCMCDPAEGEHCKTRLAWIDESRQPTE